MCKTTTEMKVLSMCYMCMGANYMNCGVIEYVNKRKFSQGLWTCEKGIKF